MTSPCPGGLDKGREPTDEDKVGTMRLTLMIGPDVCSLLYLGTWGSGAADAATKPNL